MIHSVFDARLCDLVEGHTVGLVHIDTEHLRQMPRNRLALAVGVRCKKNRVAFFGGLFKILDQILLALDIDIHRCEIMVDVDAELAFGQIADMAHRRNDFKILAEVFFNRFRLGGRLHDDKIGQTNHSFPGPRKQPPAEQYALFIMRSRAYLLNPL